MIEFKYKEYITPLPDNKIQIIPKPNAEVTIANGSIVRTFDMLIDSGADMTLIPKAAGEDLGLKMEREEKIYNVGGIGGKVPVVYRNLILTIGKERIPCPVGWILVDGVPPILGREVVFDKFHIEFLQDKETTILRKVK